MNNTNPENPSEIVAEEATPVEAAPQPEAQVPPAPPQFDVRRRLRELLSIPERDRTDEQWDELIELEIQTAPGNRISGNEQPGSAPNRGPRQHGKPGGGGGGGGAGPGGQQQKHRPRTNNNRRPRQNKPQSGGGGGGAGGTPA